MNFDKKIILIMGLLSFLTIISYIYGQSIRDDNIEELHSVKELSKEKTYYVKDEHGWFKTKEMDHSNYQVSSGYIYKTK